MTSYKQHIVRHLHSGYYNYILICFILLFMFRPYNDSFAYIAVWKTLFTLTFIAVIFNSHHHRYVKTLAIILAIPALACGWLELFFPNTPYFIATVILTIIFMTLCTISILYDVIRRAKVTLETLRGVICAYFMFAFVFAYLYYLIEYIVPGSFHLLERDTSFVTYSRDLAQMMYFSFVTLLTIGFGDITPLKDVAQTAVVIEGIIGQFYVAILVARIVSVYAFFSDKKLAEKIEKDLIKRK
jgi:voltage-gated potassium channel